MNVPYNKIGRTVMLFAPAKYGNSICKFFNNLQYLSNIRFVKNNQKRVLQSLKEEVKYRKLKVVFLCFEPAKWKCQSLYDLLLQSQYFEPLILVSKWTFKNMTKESVIENYKFFKQKKMNVEYAYDVENDIYLSLEQFKPDIIFYGEPWGIQYLQAPLKVSEYALMLYVPYFIANTFDDVEYGLDFHQYLFKHYIINNLARDFYAPRMKNKGKNLKIVGHPQLDYFYLGKDKNIENKGYVIYAPHWSVSGKNIGYGTFLWNGEFILRYAKKHPEINWVFKPHPALKKWLFNNKIWTKEQIDSYWKDWEKIAFKYESGDYLDIFAQSKAMITDCGSFLTEYFVTEKPVIHLISENSVGFNPSAEAVVKNYYKAYNINDLEGLLDKVILNNQDYMKELRIKSIQELNFAGVYASQNILDDIEKELNLIK